ncbi:MAG: hypothetical protein ACM3PE_04670 [Deltaproteobacteria bacterium]
MKKISFLLAIIILLSLLVPAAMASPGQGQVLICLIDRMNLADLDQQDTPCLWSLMQQGGIGLLNSPSAGERNTQNTYCTISAGSRVLSSGGAALNFQADESVNLEKAGNVFARNTGIQPGSHNLVASSIETIKKNNLKSNLVVPGILGDQLHQRGDSAAVIGNSDLPGYYSRLGVLLVMDSRGLVDNGMIDSSMTVPSPYLGRESNYREIISQSRQLDNAVLVIEFGDLTRMNNMSTMFSPTALMTEKKKLLRQIDYCLSEVLEQKDYRAIYVISSSPDNTALENEELLTPLIIVKPGFNGILTGISTRREGIVSSLALKDSIMSSLYSDCRESISSVLQADRFHYIQQLNHQVISNYVNQKWFLRVIFPLLFVLLVLSGILTWQGRAGRWRDLINLFIASVPLNLLVMANITVVRPWHLIPLFLIGNLLFTALFLLLARVFRCRALAMAGLFTIVCIALDLILGLGMLEKSMMSYRIMRGSRYYGLGNEYMGVLIGSAIMLASMFLQRFSSRLNRYLIVALFVAVIFLNAYPRFGANVGGTITAAIALGYTYLKYIDQVLDLKKTSVILLGTLLLLVVMSVIDLQQPAALQSHLGHNVNMLLHGESQKFGYLIIRKIQMMLKVMNFTVANWVILAGILAACYGVFRPGSGLSKFKQRVPVIYTGLKGLIVAAVAAIIFNDSGITAAASLFIYTMLMMASYWQADPGK